MKQGDKVRPAQKLIDQIPRMQDYVGKIIGRPRNESEARTCWRVEWDNGRRETIAERLLEIR